MVEGQLIISKGLRNAESIQGEAQVHELLVKALRRAGIPFHRGARAAWHAIHSDAIRWCYLAMWLRDGMHGRSATDPGMLMGRVPAMHTWH
jgi:hypothetical protein